MHSKLKNRIPLFRKLPARSGEAAHPFDAALLASPLNHPSLVERAFELISTEASGRGMTDLAAYTRKLRLSWFFDPDFYLEVNTDVAQAGEDPYRHFLLHGLAEGRLPHPLVDLKFLSNGMSRLDAPWTVEELAKALRDNRFSPHPMFDVEYYLRCNPDVRESGWPAFEHFLAHGAEEGRSPNPEFIAGWHLDQEAGLPGGQYAAFVHFARHSSGEGRLPGRSQPGADTEVSGVGPVVGAAMRADGWLDGVSDLVARGWAWLPDAPDEAVGIEVLADGRVVGLGVADLPRADLKARGLGDGCHGFRIPLSRSLQDGHVHVVRARWRGHADQMLAGERQVRLEVVDSDVLDVIPVQVATLALSRYLRESNADDASARARLTRAEEVFMALEADDLAEAAADIEALAEEWTDCGILAAKLAEVRLFSGDGESALASYERAASLRGVPVGWLQLGLGNALRRLGRAEEAAEAYADARRVAPMHGPLKVRMEEIGIRDRLLECRKLLASGRPDDASAILGGLLLRRPDDAAVQALAMQARKAASGLAMEGRDVCLVDAHRELDLLETVLIHLERQESQP